MSSHPFDSPPNRLELTHAIEWFGGDGGAEREAMLIPDLRIDGRSMLMRCTLDLRELVESTKRGGEFWIFTCGCGEPGCAGIEAPVQVMYGVECVIWQVPERGRNRTGDDLYRQFVFERSCYFEAVGEALDRARELSASLSPQASIGPHGFGVDDLRGLRVEPW